MKNLLIIPDKNNLSESLSLAKEYNLGFEYNDFFIPAVLDDEKIKNEIISKYKSCNLPSFTTLHGAFFDVTPFSLDEKIREISLLRISQSIEIARSLGAKAVVFHLNYNPFLNSQTYVEGFIKQNIEIWQSILEKNRDVNIYLENMFEKDYYVIHSIAKALYVNGNFGICLDWAHATLSEASPEEWAKALGKFIKHIHINDNDLKSDLHLAWGDGKIDRESFYNCYNKYMKNASVLIETKSIENQRKSLEQLEKEGALV